MFFFSMNKEEKKFEKVDTFVLNVANISRVLQINKKLGVTVLFFQII